MPWLPSHTCWSKDFCCERDTQARKFSAAMAPLLSHLFATFSWVSHCPVPLSCQTLSGLISNSQLLPQPQQIFLTWPQPDAHMLPSSKEVNLDSEHLGAGGDYTSTQKALPGEADVWTCLYPPVYILSRQSRKPTVPGKGTLKS